MSAISDFGGAQIQAVGMQARRLRVEIVASADDADGAWTQLEASGSGSVYQTRRFLEPWIRHVAPTLGIEPRIGVAYNKSDAPIALLPFGVTSSGLLRRVVFLGGRDSNLNLPLLDPSFSLSQEDAKALLADYAALLSPRPDLFVLANQPLSWAGRPNPFLPVHVQRSPSAAYGAIIGSDAEAFLQQRDSRPTRKKLKSKGAKLAEMGPLSFARVSAPEHVQEVLAACLAQKQQRLAQKGISAGFDERRVLAFLSELALANPPALDLYALRVGGCIAATYGGLAHGAHWHGLITSFDADPEIARCSPGDLLLRHVVKDLGLRGLRSFDLGIGEARYKEALCEPIPLADAVMPYTLRGRLLAAAERARLAAKRSVKQTPWVFKAAQRVQSGLPAGLRPR